MGFLLHRCLSIPLVALVSFFLLSLAAGWTAANMSVFFGILKVAGLFRVDPKDEEEGLDHSYHGGSAYGDSDASFKHAHAKVLALDI